MPPFALSDQQLAKLMAVATPLDTHKRGLFLERVAAVLRINGVFRPSDADLERALARALHGLRQGHSEVA